MTINDFNQQFCDAVSEVAEELGGRIYALSIPKDNELLRSLTVRFGDDPVGITIHPDLYYDVCQQGFSVADVVEEIKEDILSQERPKFNLESISRENAPAHLRAAVANYENNKDWLQEVPHERLADLAVYAKWAIDDCHSTKVNGPMLGLMQMTKEEALGIAKENTARSAKLENMNQVISRLMMAECPDDEMAMELEAVMREESPNTLYVLSTRDEYDGAAVISVPATLKQAREALGEDFYILPSSRHEVLLARKSDVGDDVDSLKCMVRTINENEVSPQDRLSDNVYEFDGRGIKIAGLELTQEHSIAETITHHRSR